MDKNMIHIDDLVRQRLNGGEEEERPGAWLHMRDLLDQKMPVAQVPGGITNWRRLLGYTAGLLLLASLSVGGYEMTTAMREQNKVRSGKVITAHAGGRQTAASYSANQQSSASAVGKTSTPSQGVPSIDEHQADTKPAVSIHSGKHADTKLTEKMKPAEDIADNNGNISSGTDNVSSKLSGPSAEETSATGNEISAIQKNNSDNKTNVIPATAINNKHLSKKAITKQIKTKPSQLNMLASAATASSAKAGLGEPAVKRTPATRKNLSKRNTSASVATSHKKTDRNTQIAAINKLSSSSVATTIGTNAVSRMAPVTSAATHHGETIDKIEIIQRMVINPVRQISSFVLDTVSISKVTVDRAVTQELVQNRQNDKADNSVAQKNNKEEDHTKGEDGKMKRSHGSGMSLMEQFNLMVQNFKYNFNHMEFTPGIIGGINSTFFGNSYSLKGFQLGLTGFWKLDENWAFITELKYMNRTSNNAVIHDDYIRHNNAGGRDSVNRYFNLSNLQSVELPIMVNYRNNRFNVFLGGSVVYNFAIDAAFVENPYTLPDANGPVNAAKLGMSDFASRLGLTYTVGVGYDITPQLKLDLRMSRMFWDNGKGSGSQIVSNDLYKSPCVQLSIGYRFREEYTKRK